MKRDPNKNPGTRSINIPFAGFYGSWYSDEVDSVQEQDAEFMADERQREDGIAPELHLTAAEFGEILFDCAEYGDCYRTIARDYADCFGHWLKDECDLDLGLIYEAMTSPREYNFQTDRIFCDIPDASVQALFAKSATDGHATLAEAIAERHTSRSGFSSFYDNALEDWLAKSVLEWDHNELCTLLLACMKLGGASDRWEFEVFERVIDDGGIYQAWEGCVDWPKFKERVADLRQAKLETIAETDPQLAARLAVTKAE